MSPSRRQLLASGVAGATAVLGGARLSGAVDPTVVISSGSTPDDVPFEHEARLVDDPPNGNPPRLDISVTNQGEREYTLQVNAWRLPFVPAVSESGELVAEFASNVDEARGTCPATRPPLTKFTVDSRALAPGSTIVDRYALLANERAALCFPPGRHRFTGGYVWGPSEDPPLEHGYQSREYGWSFDIHVE